MATLSQNLGTSGCLFSAFIT